VIAPEGQLCAMATVASAEEAMLSGDIPRARALADRAEKTLPTGSAGWLRAQDIRSQVDKGGDKDEKKKFILRYYRVFNLEQTTLPIPVSTEPEEKLFDAIQRAEEIIKEL